MPLTPVAALIVALQAGASPPSPTAPNATTAVAHRAATPPVIDGKDNDEIWRQAPVIKNFRQFSPTRGCRPELCYRGEVGYDNTNF